MRLAPAIAIDDIDDADFSGFEGPEERAARRERRQERRAARRERRAERKLRRVRRKKEKVSQKADASRSARALSRGGGTALPGGAASPPGAAPAWEEEAQLEPAPMDWPEEDPQVLDAEWSVLDEQMEQELDEELEGIGAFQPLRRLGQGVRTATQRVRAQAQARRAARQAAPTSPAGWGPNVRMGRHLRIQAAAGHRAAVIDLKPGLYLVAEIPDAVTRTEFGVAPLLAPLMIRAAKKAIEGPQEGQPPRRGPLAALFQRREGREAPIRLFRAREAQPAAPAPVPAPAPKALPGPVGPPVGSSFLLPAPNVGWADERDVAEMLGCEACEEGWR
jgi:hypothetical protein